MKTIAIEITFDVDADADDWEQQPAALEQIGEGVAAGLAEGRIEDPPCRWRIFEFASVAGVVPERHKVEGSA